MAQEYTGKVEGKVYGPGGICDTCGHFAGRHDQKGCKGIKLDYDCHCGPGKSDCKVFTWQGQEWPRPWLPAPYGLKADDNG